MTTQRKQKANQRNAKVSTGPSDTTQTRLNALQHGILSKEAVITVGEGKEDLELFEELSTALRQDLAALGSLEDLLVDQIITIAWRLRRVFKYEAASIRHTVDAALDDWVDPLERTQPINDLANLVEDLKQELNALENVDPITCQPRIWDRIFSIASKRYDVAIKEILDLDGYWKHYEEFSRDDIQQVIDAACQNRRISEEEFWQVVKKCVRSEHEEAADKWERRQRAVELQRSVASLPSDESLAKIQRYETHLSRQFYRALHELQRLQVARLSSHPLAPQAIDIDVNAGGSAGSE